MTAPVIVFSLCFLTSVLCTLLLARAYFRTQRRFLLWCALSFAFLAVNNTFVLADILFFPDASLAPYRQAAALAAVLVLVYGFMWEVD
jgi:hypothetical protein